VVERGDGHGLRSKLKFPFPRFALCPLSLFLIPIEKEEEKIKKKRSKSLSEESQGYSLSGQAVPQTLDNILAFASRIRFSALTSDAGNFPDAATTTLDRRGEWIRRHVSKNTEGETLEQERRQPRLLDQMSERGTGCRRGGSRGCRARSIWENEICAFDLRAGAVVESIAGCGYEKVKLIQFRMLLASRIANSVE